MTRLRAIAALEVAPARGSAYPEPFASRMNGREKRRLGNAFGLANFGVNLTALAPGAGSALRHAHSRQDEFVYILEGHPLLETDDGIQRLAPGMCVGFRAGDEAVYPDDDLKARNIGGAWHFFHKDDTPYPS
jgi:uncharacterized cupin superfamily protein